MGLIGGVEKKRVRDSVNSGSQERGLDSTSGVLLRLTSNLGHAETEIDGDWSGMVLHCALGPCAHGKRSLLTITRWSRAWEVEGQGCSEMQAMIKVPGQGML